jgi:hypothetical protein
VAYLCMFWSVEHERPRIVNWARGEDASNGCHSLSPAEVGGPSGDGQQTTLNGPRDPAQSTLAYMSIKSSPSDRARAHLLPGVGVAMGGSMCVGGPRGREPRRFFSTNPVTVEGGLR